jgi:hypothetical protein
MRQPLSLPARTLALPALTATVTAAAFLYRLLSLRGLPNDHYMHLAWAQQLAMGAVPGRDFVEPGMPLTVALSAAGQWLWPGPTMDVLLTMTLLAAAAGCVTWLTGRLSGSLVAAGLAGWVCLAVGTRLYSYPKVLAPALVLVLLHEYAARRRATWLVATGVAVAVAGLLRHDLAVYAAPAVAAGLVTVHWGEWRTAARALGGCAAAAALVLAPYLAFVLWAEGLGEHVRVGLEFSRSDMANAVFQWPPMPALTGSGLAAWGRVDAAALLFYVFHALVPLAALVLWRRPASTAAARPAVVAALVLMAAYAAAIFRADVVARMPDAAALLAPVAGWVVVELVRWARAGRAPVAVVHVALALVLTAATLVGTWQLGKRLLPPHAVHRLAGALSWARPPFRFAPASRSRVRTG